jgi:hypothetical protein
VRGGVGVKGREPLGMLVIEPTTIVSVTAVGAFAAELAIALSTWPNASWAL